MSTAPWTFERGVQISLCCVGSNGGGCQASLRAGVTALPLDQEKCACDGWVHSEGCVGVGWGGQEAWVCICHDSFSYGFSGLEMLQGSLARKM